MFSSFAVFCIELREGCGNFRVTRRALGFAAVYLFWPCTSLQVDI